MNVSAKLANNAVNGRETEAGALAEGLVVKKGSKT